MARYIASGGNGDMDRLVDSFNLRKEMRGASGIPAYLSPDPQDMTYAQRMNAPVIWSPQRTHATSYCSQRGDLSSLMLWRADILPTKNHVYEDVKKENKNDDASEQVKMYMQEPGLFGKNTHDPYKIH